MHRSKYLPLVLVCLLMFCSIILQSCATAPPTAVDPSTAPEDTAQTEAPASIVETTEPPRETESILQLPSVPENAREHYLFQARDYGMCGKLLGSVTVQIFFVDTSDTQWEPQAQLQQQELLQLQAQQLAQEAAGYGAALELELQFRNASVDLPFSEDIDMLFADMLLSDAGFYSGAGQNLGSDPIILFLNQPGRPYAHTARWDEDLEFACLFQDSHAFRHELLHLFGAKDFYYPDAMAQLVSQYYPDSVMLDSTNITDSFTAYLVGWTDTLTEHDLEFLEHALEVTDEEYSQASKEENSTGYVENWPYGDGLYTGNLTRGLPDGSGTFVYSSRTVYTGQWVYGKCHGTGTMVWADGTIYIGDFYRGSITGHGTMSWPSGNSYTGEFLNTDFHGQGVLTYSSGETRSGTWEHGKFVE